MRFGLVLLWLLLGSATAVARGYVIKSGDSLASIAKARGCKIADIKKANRMENNFLREGKSLRIPRACRKGRKRLKKGKKGSKKAKKGRKKRHGRPVLRTVLKDFGWGGRRHFKARVIEITLDKRKRRVVRERIFDWDKSAHDNTDWNAASTVKLFTAIATAERIKAKGFDARASVTFFDRAKTSTTVKELLEASLVKSNNIAHNRLAQLAGYDFMNGRVLRKRGLKHTAVHRPYETSRWIPMTGARTFKKTPKIVLRRGKRVRTIPAARAKGATYPCKHSAACSSMADLSSAMRRLMLHEQLPNRQRFRVNIRDLKIIRKALKAQRKRGMDVVNRIAAAFKNDELVMYHKPGFSEGWISDVVYIYRRHSRRRWIVAVAAHPGRAALNAPATAIGKALAAGAFEY